MSNKLNVKRKHLEQTEKVENLFIEKGKPCIEIFRPSSNYINSCVRLIKTSIIFSTLSDFLLLFFEFMNQKANPLTDKPYELGCNALLIIQYH